MPQADLTMLESTLGMHVDFVAQWEIEEPAHYRYRVPQVQLLLVESGNMWAMIDGRRLSAGPGVLLCVRRQPLNEYGFNSAIRYAEAHLTLAGPLLIDGEPPPSLVTLGAYLGEVRSAFTTWSQELPLPGDGPRCRVQAAAWSLLAALSAALGRSPVSTPYDAWDAVRARLEARLGRPLSLPAVARASGLSPDYLIRGFKSRFGLSPMAWRKRATLRLAADLLAAGEQVKSVAARLGFIDASSLTRAFRRQFGQSPRAYVAHGPPVHVHDPAAGRYALNGHVRPYGESGSFLWG